MRGEKYYTTHFNTEQFMFFIYLPYYLTTEKKNREFSSETLEYWAIKQFADNLFQFRRINRFYGRFDEF